MTTETPPPTSLTHLTKASQPKQPKPKLERSIKKLVKQYFETVEQHHENGFLYDELIQRVERELIVQVMKHTTNNQSQTARILGISRTTLRKKLEAYQLCNPESD